MVKRYVELEAVLEIVNRASMSAEVINPAVGRFLLQLADIIRALPTQDGEVERLRALLRPFAEAACNYDEDAADDMDVDDLGCSDVTVGHLRAAQAEFQEPCDVCGLLVDKDADACWHCG